MKNIIKSTLLLLCSVCLFTACSDDNDENPVLQQPTSFVLNTPAYAASVVELANSEGLPLTWNQPAYGFPAATSYKFDISLTGNFTVSTDEAAADETGEKVADYTTIDETFNVANGSIKSDMLAKALCQLGGWADESQVPASQRVYARLSAETTGAEKIYSNVVSFLVAPYYIELKDADPLLWYLVGSCIGSSAWGNGADAVGTGILPMYTIADYEYNKTSGTGVISYTGYFPAGGQFKLVRDPGSWDAQLNYTNVKNPDSFLSDEDGDNHNIGIVEAGCYTITLDTETNELTIEKFTGSTATHSTITMPGSYNGWDAAAGNPMTKCETLDGAQNHNWMAEVTFDENPPADGGVKFANGSWDINWGNAAFPRGTGTQGGANILYKAGTYTVFFNDLTGQYMFFEK